MIYLTWGWVNTTEGKAVEWVPQARETEAIARREAVRFASNYRDAHVYVVPVTEAHEVKERAR